ncbi:hypothetical protein B0H63DRAFT_371286, partial [Podospora didyma]
TGCCYDERMELHAHPRRKNDCPETSSRIKDIMTKFKVNGIQLVDLNSDTDLVEIPNADISEKMWRVAARVATKKEIQAVHDPSHYRWVEELSKKPFQELNRISAALEDNRNSLYTGKGTFEASLVSAGGAIETCKNVVEGVVDNAFAVIRPPGHHAEPNAAMGFCFFNNVCIAAKACQSSFPDACRRVLIVDWDVHHGNGIQKTFYEDPSVLYISIHVYIKGDFYPGRADEPSMPDGGVRHSGAKGGLGRNINIGWPSQGMGDAEYMAAFMEIIIPIAHEFDPDLVIIAAGFDAAAGDHLGGCFVTPNCYAHMTYMLMSLANGKVAVCLEGGYDSDATSSSALAVVRTLMGRPPPRMEVASIDKSAAVTLRRVRKCLAPFWECMR